jgi:hypothetical protein
MEKDHFILSALILVIMAVRSARLDLFDALLMPLRKVKK